MIKKKLLSLGMVFALSLTSLIHSSVKAAPQSGETVIQASIEATDEINYSLSPTATYTIDKNGDFIYTSPSLVNNNTFPIEVAFGSYNKVGSLTEVLKNDESVLGTLTGSETDEQLQNLWNKLGKNGSQNIALYFKDSITSEYVQNFITSEIPFATLSNQIASSGGYLEKGIVAGGDSISFDLVCFHGLAFSEPVLMTHTVGFKVDLAD